MRYRKLDENGDYVFGRNQSSYTSDASAVEQAVTTRLRQLLAEWWEDMEDGLPLWQQIIGTRDKERAERIIRERIMRTKYVRSIRSFTVDWDNDRRHLTVRAAIDTAFGEIEVEEAF